MNFSLTPENEAYLRGLVHAGMFSTEADAVNAAIVLLKRRQTLQAELQAGIDQADRGELIPAEDVFAEMDEYAAEIERRAHGS